MKWSESYFFKVVDDASIIMSTAYRSEWIVVCSCSALAQYGAVAEWLARRLHNLMLTGSNTGGAT